MNWSNMSRGWEKTMRTGSMGNGAYVQQGSEFRLGQEAKIRLPNVDEVLDKGYALHAADDPALANTEAQNDARHIIEEFRALNSRTLALSWFNAHLRAKLGRSGT